MVRSTTERPKGSDIKLGRRIDEGTGVAGRIERAKEMDLTLDLETQGGQRSGGQN
jgi:hypothetical protein